jgi:hypothetical protein
MTPLGLWDWVELGDDDGRVDRPAAVPTWSAAPVVELDGEWLLFRYPVRTLKPGRRGFEYRKIQATDGLLTEFVSLDEGQPERILDYARRYGRLGLCKHGDLSHRLRVEGCPADVCTTNSDQTAVHESLQWWSNLAGHARALLNVTAQLSKGRVDDINLGRLNPQLFFSASHLRAARRHPASFVAYGVELWLRFSQVRPRVSYNPRRKRFEIRIAGHPPLLGALALQLVLTITRSAGIAICSSCGKPFPPSRRPNLNRNAYCEKCGIRAAWREAQARRRAAASTGAEGKRIGRKS